MCVFAQQWDGIKEGQRVPVFDKRMFYYRQKHYYKHSDQNKRTLPQDDADRSVLLIIIRAADFTIALCIFHTADVR